MATPLQKRRNERMLSAALDEFSLRGFHQANVDTIARKAGVSKATLYSHFGTKELLFLAVFDQVFHTTLRPPIVDFKAVPFEEVVRSGIRHLFTRAAVTPEARFFFQCMTADAGFLGEELQSRLANRFIATSLGEMRELKDAQQAGQVSPHLNIELSHHAIIGMILQAFRYWWSRENEISAEELADQLSDFILFGLSGLASRPSQSGFPPPAPNNGKTSRGRHP